MAGKEIAVVDGDRVDVDTGEVLPVPQPQGAFDLAQVENPTHAIQVAEELVGHMARKCDGPQYVSVIQGRRYPKVEFWTTIGAALGLFPREESTTRVDLDGVVGYEAVVGVYRGDQMVTRASAICSRSEKTWQRRDEYAIRSMAVTRATGKAYRLGLSFLAVMAGLEATPAEEMPDSPGNGHTQQRAQGRPSAARSDPDKEFATEAQVHRIRTLAHVAEITPERYMEITAAVDRGVSVAWANKAIAGLEKRARPEDLAKVQAELVANGVAAEVAEQEADLPFEDSRRDLAPSAVEEGH